MDNGDLENNHQNFHGSSGKRLSAESLPLIDTRLLSQSELCALAHCSSLSPFSSASFATSVGRYDDLTPKIDRSVFNESAGSRKQTFLRLRLARHPQPPEPSLPQHQRDEPSREEQSQVASLLRSLFNVDSIRNNEPEHEDNEGQIHYNSYVYQRPNLDSIQNVHIQGISGNEIKRKRGRPRKIQNPSEETEGLHLTGEPYVYKPCSNLGLESRYGGSGISMDSNSGKRKRGRPPTSRDSFNQLAVRWKSEDKDELMNMENREGTMVDLSALANVSEDPYGEELRRITVGLKTKEEMLGLLEQLNGEWVNKGKKKKVVKACEFGGYLPRGWKLMLCIKKKGSNVWLACRRYISPDGQQYDTCKEVSMYLQSLLQSGTKNELNFLQFDNKTLGQQPVMGNESLQGHSDSMNLHVKSNQNHRSERPGSEVVEEVKDTENGNVADGVKTSLVEKDENADFLNGNYDDHIKKRDGNIENLVALSNSEAQYGEKMKKDLLTATEELQQYFTSQAH